MNNGKGGFTAKARGGQEVRSVLFLNPAPRVFAVINFFKARNDA
jgi:hypothetical protein